MQPSESAGNQTAARSPHGTAHWLALLLLLAAGAAVRLLNLARKPFWFDECFSVEVARIGWGDFLRLLWWREANMALYYALLRMWLHLGQTEFFVRSLSVLLAAATLPVIYWMARMLYDRRVALITATLFTFNAYSVRYSQEARSYALFLLLATLSSALLVAYLREPARPSRFEYIVVSVLAVYSHFYALLLIVMHWLTVKTFRPGLGNTGTKLSTQLRRSWFTIALAVLPLLIFVAKTGAGPIRWITRPGPRDLFEFFEHFSGGISWILPVIYIAACAAAAIPVGTKLFARAQDWETWRTQFLLIWLFFPVVLTALLSLARPVFLGRYMIFCLPALLILVSAGLARLRHTWILGTALAVILFFSSQGIFYVYGNDFDKERDAFGAATAFILDHSQPDDGVLFYIPATRAAYEFFRSERAGQNTASPDFTRPFGPEILFPHHAAGLDYRDFTGKPTGEFLRAIATTHPRVWIMLMNNGGANPDPTTLLITTVLAESFPKVQTWNLTKVAVRLYSKQ
jgi:mannosyltransferase